MRRRVEIEDILLNIGFTWNGIHNFQIQFDNCHFKLSLSIDICMESVKFEKSVQLEMKNVQYHMKCVQFIIYNLQMAIVIHFV